MGERAETYLRLLAESELRRALPAAGIPGTAASAGRVRWAGELLVEAGVLADQVVSRIAADLDAALAARPHLGPEAAAGRVSRMFDRLARQLPDPRPHHRLAAAPPMRVTPIGRTLTVAHDRAPCDLHLLTLVRTPASAVITVVMRMHWPPDGSSTDLEITGAGPQHLPYDQLWMLDDRGSRYRVRLDGEGGTATWQGIVELSPAPPPDARWLDLIADGTCPLIRLDLQSRVPPSRVWTEPGPAPSGGERLLAVQAERILASAWGTGVPRADRNLGEMITVLAGAGAIAADSRTPGHLAALCQRLGVAGQGITAPAAAELPAPWASILAQREAGPAGSGPEWFAPLAAAGHLAGTRVALAGLSSAAGQSHLHVVAGALPAHGPGLSVWVRNGAGSWHVAEQAEPRGPAPGEEAFRMRLTPPLSARPDVIEVVVTGPASRIRAVAPVGEARE